MTKRRRPTDVVMSLTRSYQLKSFVRPKPVASQPSSIVQLNRSANGTTLDYSLTTDRSSGAFVHYSPIGLAGFRFLACWSPNSNAPLRCSK
jgi:hypothetical protein